MKQVWYADDATAAGKIADLRGWWSRISALGPYYGYFVNPSKTWLVTKDGCSGLTSEHLGDTNVNTTSHGLSVLGSPIGTLEYISSIVNGIVHEKVAELYTLSQFADDQPHTVYSALTHSFYSKWNYLVRTVPDINDLLSPLEDALRVKICSN